jgi:hypothetical protein
MLLLVGVAFEGPTSRRDPSPFPNLYIQFACVQFIKNKFELLCSIMHSACGMVAFGVQLGGLSQVTFDGTHPHQWTPPATFTVYSGDWTKTGEGRQGWVCAVWAGTGGGEWADGRSAVGVSGNAAFSIFTHLCALSFAHSIWHAHTPTHAPSGGLTKGPRTVEVFVCHNGDFDAWAVNGTAFELGDLQAWLPRATGAPMPCVVDSGAVVSESFSLSLARVDTSRARFCFRNKLYLLLYKTF